METKKGWSWEVLYISGTVFENINHNPSKKSFGSIIAQAEENISIKCVPELAGKF
jgi:hypothetical protein